MFMIYLPYFIQRLKVILYFILQQVEPWLLEQCKISTNSSNKWRVRINEGIFAFDLYYFPKVGDMRQAWVMQRAG